MVYAIAQMADQSATQANTSLEGGSGVRASGELPTRPASRSSSMRAQASDSGGQSEVEHRKPSAKAPSDASYSMNRWLNQEPSGEPRHGLGR